MRTRSQRHSREGKGNRRLLLPFSSVDKASTRDIRLPKGDATCVISRPAILPISSPSPRVPGASQCRAPSQRFIVRLLFAALGGDWRQPLPRNCARRNRKLQCFASSSVGLVSPFAHAPWSSWVTRPAPVPTILHGVSFCKRGVSKVRRLLYTR